MKILIFGNSGSGKSTLAKKLAAKFELAHLDLDTVAWQAVLPPQRMEINESKRLIDTFIAQYPKWVIEGCYADLLTGVSPKADEMIFLDLPIEACIENAKNRPWEAHKYESKTAQDENLPMLIEWITQYPHRNDTFSKAEHEKLYEHFKGKKTKVTSNIT